VSFAAAGTMAIAIDVALTPVGVVAVTVTEPRLPVGVSVAFCPFAAIAAIVASLTDQSIGTSETTASFASNAFAFSVTVVGAITLFADGVIERKATFCPGPTYAIGIVTGSVL
jgi:hypothetical protein